MAPSVELPWRIGRFPIVAEVGRGVHATVYEARDPASGTTVAVKVATAEGLRGAGGRTSFRRGAELMARLEHPRIVRIHEAGEDDGRVFLVEEFCGGGDLAAWIERHPGPLDPRAAALVVRDLASAAAFAHASHVVHRAIMPANVLLVPAPHGILVAPAAEAGRHADGDRCHVRLADYPFSAFETAVQDRSAAPIAPRPRPGTLAWLAPEQVEPSFGGVGPATDVHGLGLLLHCLLTGRNPAAGRSDAETLRRILFDEPPAADRGVPRGLRAIDLRCRAKDPRRRYAHAGDLADDLTRFLAGMPTKARVPSWTSRMVGRVRRRPLGAALLALVPLLIVAGAVVVRQQRIVERQRLAIRSLDGANEMRRSFEAWYAGRVPEAVERSQAAAAKYPRLAGGLAGRWLLRRTHGEEAVLVPPTAAPAADGPRDLYCVAVSPGGAPIAVGRADGLLMMVSVDAAGHPVGAPRTVRAHDEINDVAFSPDGSLLVTAGQDGRVCTWRSDTLALVAEIATGEQPLYAAAFSRDGALVAWGGDARMVSVAPVDGAGRAAGPTRSWSSLRDHPAGDDAATRAIDAIVFTDADSLVAVAGGVMLAIAARDGSIEREFVGPKHGLGLVNLSADGQTLLTGGRDGVARLWSVASGALVRSFPRLPGSVQGADIAPDGTWIAAGCRDGVIRVFDVATGAERNRLIGHAGRTWDVRCDPAGRILSTGEDGSLRCWEPTVRIGASGLRTIELPEAVRHVVPDSTAGRLLAISASGSSAWIDPRTGVHGAADRLVIDAGGQVGWSAWDSAWAGTGSAGGLVIQAGSGAVPRHVLDGESLGGIVWTGPGTLVTSVAEGTAWRMVTVSGLAGPTDGVGVTKGSLLHDAALGLASTSVAPARLAVAAGGLVRILPLDSAGRPDTRGSRNGFVGPGARIMRMAWNRDGIRLACGDDLGRVRVVDPRSGAVVATMAQLAGACGALAWSADGESLVVGDRESVRLCDGRTAVLFDEIRPGWEIHSVLFVGDGTRDTALVIGGAANDGTGRVAVLDLRE